MLQKAITRDAKELTDTATEYYNAAAAERASFDMDIEILAEAAFRLNGSPDDFVTKM